jgi:hypothetical protein
MMHSIHRPPNFDNCIEDPVLIPVLVITVHSGFLTSMHATWTAMPGCHLTTTIVYSQGMQNYCFGRSSLQRNVASPESSASADCASGQ